MRSLSIIALATIVAVVGAMPKLPMHTSLVQRATPKVYLAGDSTMTHYAASSVIQGWGEYLPFSLSLSVVNKAIGGRSARSFTVENRFAEITKLVQPGDFVVIEFGHNDGGSPNSSDNGRSDCPGAGEVTCTTKNGTLVKTFDAYMSEAAQIFAKLGVYVIVSSQTPNNPWESGNFSYAPGRFVSGAALAVKSVANVNVTFVDHGQYIANAFMALGKEAVNAMYPNDHTHTSPAGADVVSKAFVKSVVCGDNLLKNYVKNETSTIPGACI